MCSDRVGGVPYLSSRESHGHDSEVFRVGEKLGLHHRGIHLAVGFT